MSSELNEKQARFCLEYLKDLNASQAAIRAGYSQATAGSIGFNLLKKIEIQAELDKVRKKLSAKLEITVERILAEYAKLSFSSLGDFIKPQADGTAYFDLSAMTPEQMAAIQEFQVDEYTEGKGGAKGNGKGETGREVKRMKIKLHDKKGALDSVARHLGMFVERVEVPGLIDAIDRLALGRQRVANAKRSSQT